MKLVRAKNNSDNFMHQTGSLTTWKYTKTYLYTVTMYICTMTLILMHLSIIETPTPPPPPRAYVGQCGGFLWYLKAWLARGGGGFLRICLAYSWKSGSEVGI